MEQVTVIIDQSGRILIPARIRESLGLRGGERLVLVREEDGLRLLTRAQAVARAQRIVRRHVPDNESLVDELLSERQDEAARE